MGSVVTCHALEAPGEYLFLLADLLKSLGDIFRQSLQFVPDLWETLLYGSVILLGLVHVGSPFLAVVSCLVYFKLVGNSLNFKHPLFSAN